MYTPITELPTGITPDRLSVLIAQSYFCNGLEGAFAEFGVMMGGSLELLSKLHSHRRIYGIDGFNGLPECGEHDLHVKGDFALADADMDRLYCTIDTFPETRVVVGYSPAVFTLLPPDEKFAFVHIDVDIYTSINDALSYFMPRMVAGGRVVFDDYGFPSTPGAKKAIDEWKGVCHWRGAVTLDAGILTGQYLIIK